MLVLSITKKHYRDIKTKLKNAGHLQKFSMSVKPNQLPGLSSQLSELHTWDAGLKEYCLKHCPDARDIWNDGEVRHPVLLEPAALARILMEEGYTESATESDIERCIAIWTKRKLAQSSLNRNYDNTISWLVAQIREASKEVEILDNKIKVIENNDIAAMKREIYQHYQELDEFMKMEAACGFDCLRVKKGWTLRKFYDLVLRVLLALKRLGISVNIQDQQFVYLKSAYMIYGDKGYQGSTRKWITNPNFLLQRIKDTYEAM
jgi:hypothetical protein